jgi:hypothetical protein
MAHSCPDCGSVCYCSGDIDDCLIDDTEDQNACLHCFDEDSREDDCDEDWDTVSDPDAAEQSKGE